MKRKQTRCPAAKRTKRKIPKVKRRKRKIPEVKKTIATPKTWKAVEPVGLELETKIRLQQMRRILQPILQWPKRFLFVHEWYNSAIQPKMESVMSSMNTITGIEKKYERTGELPPGWEKKLAVGNRLDRDIYNHARIIVPLGEDGLVTVRIENKVVRLIQATREIVEILD